MLAVARLGSLKCVPKGAMTCPPNGFPIMRNGYVRFTPLRITVSGAGVSSSINWDPNTAPAATFTVRPTRAGTLTVTTGGEYYDKGSTTVKVWNKLP